MCTKNQLDEILGIMSDKIKKIDSDNFYSIILYGSYARGDFDEESDIDIMVLLNSPLENISDYQMEIDSICGEILYEYGMLVSVNVRDIGTFLKYSSSLPYYRNILKEGVKIA